MLIKIEDASEIIDRSQLLKDDKKIHDLTGLLAGNTTSNDPKDSLNLNDLTDLNNATGLEKLSS